MEENSDNVPKGEQPPIPRINATVALMLWYLLPVVACIGLGWWIGGSWGLLVAASGFAWPVGNIVWGIMMGCD